MMKWLILFLFTSTWADSFAEACEKCKTDSSSVECKAIKNFNFTGHNGKTENICDAVAYFDSKKDKKDSTASEDKAKKKNAKRTNRNHSPARTRKQMRAEDTAKKMLTQVHSRHTSKHRNIKRPANASRVKPMTNFN